MDGFDDPLKLVGTTIADKYAIESVVGQGGFAIVYRATHILWKRPIAVKVFKALGEVAKDKRQKLLDDFIQEGALLADLSERSTAIVQARDVGMLTAGPGGEQVPYMVLEWLDGMSLEDVLQKEKAANAPLRTLEQTVKLLDPVAEALGLAHKRNIAHRDVKPANVFVLGDPREPTGVKLLDFGIAKVVQDAQKMGFGKTAGHITSFTPLYAAPEQFDRGYGATGPWTDVFALALVVAEVLTGKEPLAGDTFVQLALSSSNPHARPTPRFLGASLADDIEAIFQKAVAVKTEDRFQTAGDFWNALRVRVLGDRMSTLSSSRRSGEEPVAPVAAAATVVAPPGSQPGELAGMGGMAGMQPAGGAAFSSTGPGVPSGLASTGPSPASANAKRGGGGAIGAVLGVIGAVVLIGGGAGAYVALHKGARPGPRPVSSNAAPLRADDSASASASASAAAAGRKKKRCGPGMVFVPGGEFFMGSEEKDAFDFEKPPHKVKIEPYCLDVHEVTVAKYKECSDEGKCRRAGKENEWPGIKPAQRKIYDPLCNINDVAGKREHPINCVDWDQAREYCEAHEGRLPTEAEWEFAARGSDGRVYPWGDEPPNAQLLNACGKECVAWMKKHPDPDVPSAQMYDEDDGFANTAPVGSFPKGKSKYGVEDIVGNVWEWVADYYAEYDKASASKMTVDPKGPEKGTDRVIRGGSWNGSMPSWVRPSFRFHAAPSSRSYGFGIRCAKAPKMEP